MKKNNSKGFVLAETLVVTVFLMVIFSMIYTYFYPLIGEYEKREVYDDVDGKYAVYWLKRMIEDSSYNISSNSNESKYFETYGYIRFKCDDIKNNDNKKEMCKTLVNALEVEDCDINGNTCNIFITRYTLKKKTGDSATYVDFKTKIKEEASNIKKGVENCKQDSSSQSTCLANFKKYCKDNNKENISDSEKVTKCNEKADEKVFRTGFQDYIATLPNYYNPSLNGAKYRVIASFHHKKDNNNYYSYATIEVNK